MTRLKIGFICTHNACRSQIAEAMGRHLAADVLESCSAGTNIKEAIDPAAARLMKEHYGIDMVKEGQHTKTLSEIGSVDVVVTMGCGVQCPSLPCQQRFDWRLEDPTGKDDAAYLRVMEEIRQKIVMLRQQILAESVR